MSPRTNCCVICGYIIWDYGTLEDRWIAEFRVTYSNPEGCFVSGVGINKDPDEPLQASSDPTKRYDDDDYDPHLTKEFFVSFCWEETISFASHNACWALFEEASKPDDIPLKRFIEVCSSLPLTGIAGLFHWGHNYGGIYSFAKSYAFPWEYRFEDDPSDREAWRCATENPYNTPSLSKLIARTAHKPSIPQIPFVNQSGDCFAKLPWELREAIANQLPTHDALALRESTRSFQPLLRSSTFWASRFQRGLDRGIIFENPSRPELRDWLSLYRSTSHRRSPAGLKNRIRIWNLISHILVLLGLRLSDYEDRDCNLTNDTPTLIEANGSIMELISSQFGGYNVLQDGCRLLKTQHAYVPQNLDSISLSFIAVGDHGHLTGLRFNSKDGTEIQLGYPFAKGTLVYKIDDLSGFILAIDPKGVRAVKIVHRNEDTSAWFGFPKMTPVTERLRVIDTTKPIRVSVDGYKIIGITANRPEDRLDQSCLPAPLSSLRTVGLWYPSVPDRRISLNEQNLQEKASLTTGYTPLHWGYFGGPRGGYLQHLTGVSLGYLANPLCFDFHYDTGSQIDRSQLGQIGDPDDPTTNDISLYHIDGPGGEMIESVEIARRRGAICALKLTTNRGTIFGNGTTSPPRPRPPFPGAPIPEPEPEAQFERLTIAPNTRITGFYAPDTYGQLFNLGITSEVTDQW